MKTNKSATVAAAAVLVALGMAASAPAAQAAGGKEKCYGIAKAGKNDCADANGTHSCAGQAKVDKGAAEWLYTASGTCVSQGGKTTPPAKP